MIIDSEVDENRKCFGLTEDGWRRNGDEKCTQFFFLSWEFHKRLFTLLKHIYPPKSKDLSSL